MASVIFCGKGSKNRFRGRQNGKVTYNNCLHRNAKKSLKVVMQEDTQSMISTLECQLKGL